MKSSHMKKISVLCVAAPVCFLLLVVGCVKIDRPSLDRTYYSIDVERKNGVKHTSFPSKNIIVRRFRVSPRYEGKNFVYRRSENIYKTDYYNVFFISPSAMLTEELKVWMNESGLFVNVLDPGSLGSGDLLLEGVVNSIYGDYSGKEPFAVIKMQFFLLDNSSPELPIIYSCNLSKKIPAKDAEVASLVSAMNKGVAEIFKELESGLAAVVAEKVKN